MQRRVALISVLGIGLTVILASAARRPGARAALAAAALGRGRDHHA